MVQICSRSAVVRGRVVTLLGTGLVGVRVSTDTPLEGFTLTREDGWFDLLVNGGGAVTLNFGRAPFKRATKVVYVPWNEVIASFFNENFFMRAEHFIYLVSIPTKQSAQHAFIAFFQLLNSNVRIENI